MGATGGQIFSGHYFFVVFASRADKNKMLLILFYRGKLKLCVAFLRWTIIAKTAAAEYLLLVLPGIFQKQSMLDNRF